MAPSLPDEVLSEILAPVLQVSDAQFCDASASFIRDGEPVSSILLASPPLCCTTLLSSALPARLRVEGGFGAKLELILQKAPNTTDLFISLDIRASDLVKGLVSAFPHINPRRLILGPGTNKNKQINTLMDKLESAALGWDNLKSLVFPYPFDERRDFFMKLARIPSVKEVSFSVYINSSSDLPSVSEVVRIPCIQTVEIRSKNSAAAAEEVLSDASISPYQSKLRFVDERNDDEGVVPPSLPILPLTSSPWTVPDIIWARILFLAMRPDQLPEKTIVKATFDVIEYMRRGLPGRKREKDTNSERLSHLLVSKTFHRIGLAYLYRWPVLTSKSLPLLHSKILANPSLALHMRELHSQADSVTIPCDMRKLFTHTPRLTRVGIGHGMEMSWAVFCTLANTTGSSLVELAVHVVPPEDTAEPPRAAVFCLFTALRKLTWNSPKLLIPSSSDASGGLPVLEYLDLGARCAAKFTPALASMELPNINHVVFQFDEDSTHRHNPAESDAFLERHGDKIRQLAIPRPNLTQTLDLCPQLQNLGIHLGQPALHPVTECLKTFKHPRHHPLQKITLRKSHITKVDDVHWDATFDALAGLPFANFPALLELQVIPCVWPEIKEHAINQSLWVPRAERMIALGIKVADSKVSDHTDHCENTLIIYPLSTITSPSMAGNTQSRSEIIRKVRATPIRYIMKASQQNDLGLDALQDRAGHRNRIIRNTAP
ncbi:hypothetical protein FB45DRAFT_1059888 [Roridomyces roridus]|uniref:Uncharacterized protein n=1 Tax=Roridomyces roridus TaxID=1738132 RepID=A0AAD7FJ98_9AGAR|nr:hypothetical protein FB45DRAFT_1059888 [Roridomyces roridus]